MSSKDPTPTVVEGVSRPDGLTDEDVRGAIRRKARAVLADLPPVLREEAEQALRKELAREKPGYVPLPVWALSPVLVMSVIYVLNFTFGVFEIIPDNLPIIGQLDEASFIWVAKQAYDALQDGRSWLFRHDDEAFTRLRRSVHGACLSVWYRLIGNDAGDGAGTPDDQDPEPRTPEAESTPGLLTRAWRAFDAWMRV